MQFNNDKSREQVGTFRQVGTYTIHRSYISRSVTAAVSKRGQVIHRCRDVNAGVLWAQARTLDIHTGITSQKGSNHAD